MVCMREMLIVVPGFPAGGVESGKLLLNRQTGLGKAHFHWPLFLSWIVCFFFLVRAFSWHGDNCPELNFVCVNDSIDVK